MKDREPESVARRHFSAVVITDVPLTHSYPSGFSSRVLHFIEALGQRASVDVISLRRSSQALPSAPQIDGIRSMHEIDIDLPPKTPFERVRLAVDRLTTRDVSFSRARRSRATVRSVLETCEPDVVILHLPYLAHLGRSVEVGVPVVFLLEEAWERLHRSTPTSLVGRAGIALDRWRVPHLYRWIGARAASVGVISEAEKNQFSRYIDPRRMVVYPHGVDTDRFARTTNNRDIDNHRDIDVLIVGDMRQERNLAPVLNLLNDGGAEGCGQWYIVGPTNAPNPLPLDHVTWTGLVPSVIPYYARTQVAVVPTAHGTGVKGTLLQAWACGVPVVASSFAARSVEAEPGRDVLIGDTTKQTRAQAARILSDPDLAASLGRNGRARARERDIRKLSGEFADHVSGVVRSV